VYKIKQFLCSSCINMTTTEDMDPSSLKDGSMIYLGIYVTISGLMFSSSVHVAVKRR